VAHAEALTAGTWPGPWKVVSPPRLMQCTSAPAFTSCSWLTLKSACEPRLPTVKVGGCCRVQRPVSALTMHAARDTLSQHDNLHEASQTHLQEEQGVWDGGLQAKSGQLLLRMCASFGADRGAALPGNVDSLTWVWSASL
jgi:hypothetical protein